MSFNQEMRIRSGAESVISELVRGYGARRARYRGQRKNEIQLAFIGVAANLKRLALAAFCLYPPFTQPFIISPVSPSSFFNRVICLVTFVIPSMFHQNGAAAFRTAVRYTDGSLKYTFMESLVKNYPYWHLRTLAGVVFTVGMLFFIYNIFMTIRKGKALAATQA